MLIASIGKRIGPIAQLLESQEFAVLKLIRYGQDDSDTLFDEVKSITPDIDVSIHVIDVPTLDDEDAGGNIPRDLFKQLMDWTERSPNAKVCVTGGTPWLSHTLHHAATLANLPVIVSTHKKVEGSEMMFRYPKPLETERMKTILMTGQRGRVNILMHIEERGRVTIPELSDVMGVSDQTISFILNGRERGASKSEDIVLLGLTGIEEPLIRFVGKRETGERGPKAAEYELTEFGRDVTSLLRESN
uniref:Uncharacterized protein n=1 Tax=uncultured marine group II/III euryarchaeote KM3_16_D12 TaxID=1457926 RepID=A0A075GJ34_9EURY|nr:hypothetical protein [uncultured marine group II/III euryarchaeote KM3_16_D12]